MEDRDSSDEDVFECGRCREKFSSLEEFMEHKNKRVCRKPKVESTVGVEVSSLPVPPMETEHTSGNGEDGSMAVNQVDNIIMAASIASGIDNLAAAALECQKQEGVENPPQSPKPTASSADQDEGMNDDDDDEEMVEISLASYNITCSFCSSAFTNQAQLRAHFTTTHRIGIEQVEKLVKDLEKKVKKTTKPKPARKAGPGRPCGRKRLPTDCKVCGKNFGTRKGYMKHSRTKHHLNRVQQQNEIQGKRLKKCSLCSFSANSAKELTDHSMTLHGTGESEGVVKKAGRGRPRKIRPLAITKSTPVGQCPECGKVLKGKLLTAHVKRCQDKNSIQKCSECGKSVLKKALYRHQRRCINKRHLICPLCQHQSRERYDYTLHVNNHKSWLPAEPGDTVPPLDESGEDANEQNSQDVTNDVKSDINQNDGQDTISTLDLAALGLTPTPQVTGQDQNAIGGEELGGVMARKFDEQQLNAQNTGSEALKPGLNIDQEDRKDSMATLDLSVLGLTPTPTAPTSSQNQATIGGGESMQSTNGDQDDSGVSKSDETTNAIESLLADADGDAQRITRQKQLKCHSCDSWFNRTKFKYHMFSVHNLVKRFQCRVDSCMQAITVIEDFLEHTKAHENHSSFTCGCRSCLIRNANTDNPEYIAMLKKQKLKEYYQGMEFKCDKCWVKFPTAKGLEKHNRKETHSHPCTVCGKVQVSKRQLRMHAITHLDERNFLCEECGASFKTKRDLSKHRMSHSDFKPFVCQDCGKGFLFKNKLDRHRMTVHSNEKPFKCTVANCDKAFSRRDKLNDHARTHLYYEPFHCRFCPKGFFRKDNLKDHEVLHTKDYRFKCDRCPKGFMRPKLLARHIAHEHQSPDRSYGEGVEGASQNGQQQVQTSPMKLTKPKSRSKHKKATSPAASSISTEAQTQNLSSQITYMIYQQAAGSSMAAALQQAMQSVNAGPDGCPVTLPAEVLQAYHLTQQATKDVHHNFQVTPVVATEEQILPEALHDRAEFRLA